jgi:hypothetical protein
MPAAFQRIPASRTAWLEFDGASPREVIWLVWSRSAIDLMENARRFSRPPSFGELPENDALKLRGWLGTMSTGSPPLQPSTGGFVWTGRADPLVGKIDLQVTPN